MRIAILLAITGCSFTGSSAGVDDGTPTVKDAFTSDAALIDAKSIDAKPIDAKPIDARPIDAKPIDAATIPVRFVQGNGAAANAVSLQANETGGDLNVIGVSWPSSTITVVSVTDTDGNTYKSIGAPIVINSTGTLAMFYAPDIRQGVAANTITVRFSSMTNPIVVAAEYAGLAQTNPLDVTSSGTGFSGTATSGSATTTHPHELLVGIAAATKALSAGTGFTAHVPAILDVIEDREVTVTGTYDATATLSSQGIWLIGIAGFVAAD